MNFPTCLNRFRNSLNFSDFPSKVGIVIWGIWAVSRFYWCCCWNWLNYCLSPIFERLTESGLLQLSQECFHCEIVTDLKSAPSFVLLTKVQGSKKESLVELKSPCDKSSPALNPLDYYSGQQRTLIWDKVCLRNNSQSFPGFLSRCSWIFLEQVWTCGFRRNSSSLDKEPKMRDSVRPNYWENFLVTFPSFSSETWVMYSPAIPGSSVFCDWLFLAFSGVSLETGANFLWFLNVALIFRRKLCQLWRLNWFFNL